MIETEVEGKPGDVRSAATWLRETLQDRVADSADRTNAGRQLAASEWEGSDGTAYRAYAKSVVTICDDHASRVGRAATSFDSYAARLDRMKSTMRGLRGEASSGGLTVSGTVISTPPDVPATVVQPGSPEETEHLAGVAKVDLYDRLAGDAATARTDFDLWIQANLKAAVTDAEDSSAADQAFDQVQAQFPSMLNNLGTGIAGYGLGKIASDYQGLARELKRKSRVSGDPRVRGSADTPSGKSKIDDLLKRSTGLGKLGKLMGPAGILLDVYLGYRDYQETGDWKRAALTTGGSIAVGVGAAGLVALGVVTAPAWLVIGGTVVVGAAVSAGIGYVYDHWDDISGWTGDRWDDTKDLAEDAWDGAKDLATGAKDKVGGAWDAVTPW